MFYVFTLLPFLFSLSLSLEKAPLLLMIILLLVVTCIGYLLYIKNHRYLSFGSGCLFFLWYWWTASDSIFTLTLTHTPFIINSPSKGLNQQSVDVSIWPINIIANQTQINVADLPLLLSNKNAITAGTCLGKQNAPIW
jgi:hypothetical protein